MHNKEWVAFELHCHSIYSKGKRIRWESFTRPREIVRMARKRGLAGIALTDHNTTKGWSEARDEAKRCGILFIPGIEVSTQSGHIIGLGVSEHVPEGQPLDVTIDAIRAQGGIVIAPHPFDIYNNGVKHAIVKVDVVESFNALAIDRFSNIFCDWYARRLGLVTVGGSDAHSLDMIGLATNLVPADDIDSLLKAIKRGDVIKRSNYSSLSILMEWTRERFARSYNDIIAYTYNYWRPKGAIVRWLVSNFVKNSKSRLWSGVATLGLGISTLYSGLKILTY